MDKKDLTLCLMVKNEEKGLKRAVDSAASYVREAIIGVDSDSYDMTLDIARELTPNVFLFQFNNDFSFARNSIQKCAKTRFVLWLDGHEYLEKGIDFAEFDDVDIDAFLVRTRWDGDFEVLQPKILRKDVEYTGAIHEQPQIKRPKSLLKPLIVHDRFGGQDVESIRIKEEQRERMMNEIMAEELKKNKKNLHALFQMGIYRQGTGKIKEACHYYEQYLKYQPKDNCNFLVYLNFGLCQMQRGRFKTASQILKKGVDKCGKMWELNYILAGALSAQKKHKEAIGALIDSIEPNIKPQIYYPFRRKLWEIWGAVASEFLELKDYPAALDALDRAAQLAPDQATHQIYLNTKKNIIELNKKTA